MKKNIFIYINHYDIIKGITIDNKVEQIERLLFLIGLNYTKENKNRYIIHLNTIKEQEKIIKLSNYIWFIATGLTKKYFDLLLKNKTERLCKLCMDRDEQLVNLF